MTTVRRTLVRAVGTVPPLDRLARRAHRALVHRRGPAARPGTAAAAAAPASTIVHVALPHHPDGRAPAGLGYLPVRAEKQFYVSRELAARGLQGYEPEALACLLATCETAGPGELMDVGANVGVYSTLAAACTTREVHAFEPTPNLVAEARRVAGAANLEVSFHEIAVSDEVGTATFYLSDRTDASNSLREGFRPSTSSIEVGLDTLDALAERHRWTPAVIKIDTEATEPHVLRGAHRVLTEHRPWVLCEVLAGRTEDDLMEIMRPYGYTWMHIADQLPYPAQDVVFGDTEYRHLMWLFAPEPPSEEFWSRLRAWTEALQRTADPVRP